MTFPEKGDPDWDTAWSALQDVLNANHLGTLDDYTLMYRSGDFFDFKHRDTREHLRVSINGEVFQ